MDEEPQILEFDQVVSLLFEWKTRVVIVSFGLGECAGRLTRMTRSDSKPMRGSVQFGCGNVSDGAEIDFYVSEQDLIGARLEGNGTWLKIETKRGQLAIERDPAQYAHSDIA